MYCRISCSFKEFGQLLDDNLALLVRLQDLVIVWVQEGFQNFFRTLHNQFLIISGKTDSVSQQHVFPDSTQGDKTVAGLVLVLSQLSVFIEQNAIPRITEEIATSFSDGGARGSESGPAFVPAEICRIFRSAGEKFLHLFIVTAAERCLDPIPTLIRGEQNRISDPVLKTVSDIGFFKTPFLISLSVEITTLTK